MAFSKLQRKALISQITANSAFSDDQLEDLTDNQLVALNSPAQLDALVNNACSTSKKLTSNEDDMEAEDEMEDEEDSMDSEEDGMEEETPEAGSKKPAPPKNPVEAKVNKTAEQTTNAWMRKAPPEIRRLVANARAVEQQQREQLIATITANASCTLTEEQLQTRSTEDLQVFAQMASAASGRQEFAGYDFGAAAGAFSVNSSQKIEALPLPTADYMKN